ncbi:hypothetical protein BJ508DRAFT_311012 [Ascobolus immersus RN42]|uniref:Uncharacterized protein n=1 Tax=Ascobolus immersus RN42 TaxID=1160509 RepID=A0A3N4HRN4_ASCIM|nr:hypothetical protein BJ508DRAFT_311012 [Ascobolus immersus RN42]
MASFSKLPNELRLAVTDNLTDWKDIRAFRLADAINNELISEPYLRRMHHLNASDQIFVSSLGSALNPSLANGLSSALHNLFRSARIFTPQSNNGTQDDFLAFCYKHDLFSALKDLADKATPIELEQAHGCHEDVYEAIHSLGGLALRWQLNFPMDTLCFDDAMEFSGLSGQRDMLEDLMCGFEADDEDQARLMKAAFEITGKWLVDVLSVDRFCDSWNDMMDQIEALVLELQDVCRFIFMVQELLEHFKGIE